MAIGRLSVTAGHAGEANTWYDYVTRQGIHAPEQGDTERVILKESGNMPEWAKDDPRFFWEMADEKEPYANGTTYRQHIVTLPRGLSDEQLIELAKRHIDKHNQGRFAYTFAIHCPIGIDGKEQPHLHYMFNEKIIDGIERGADTYFKRYNAKNPERGGGKKDNTGLTHQERDVQLQEVRNQWEVTCNEYLAEIGHPERIDMRNWQDRGETQAPVNISMKAMFNKEVKQAYKDKLNAQAMLETATNDLDTIDLETELTNAQNRLAREIAKFEHHKGISERFGKLATYDNAQLTQAELRQFDKATYQNIVAYEPKALAKINDIITKVRMGEPLSKQNETDYRYSKAFLNHTQAMRDSGELKRLRQAEIAIQRQQQEQAIIAEQVQKLGAIVSEILPPKQYREWEQLFTAELIKHRDSEQIQADIIKDTAGREVMPDLADQLHQYKRHIDTVATIGDITARREELARKKAEIPPPPPIVEPVTPPPVKAPTPRPAPVVEPVAPVKAVIEPVKPVAPIEPPPPQVNPLTAKQQIIIDNFAPYFEPSELDEFTEQVRGIDDKDLLPLPFDNDYTAGHEQYIKLVHQVAQADKNAQLDKLGKELQELQDQVQPRPEKGMFEREATYTKRYNDFVNNVEVPHRRLIDKKRNEIDNVKNFGKLTVTQAHHAIVSGKYPELAEQSQAYSQFEQLKAEIERQLRELDRQQTGGQGRENVVSIGKRKDPNEIDH